MQLFLVFKKFSHVTFHFWNWNPQFLHLPKTPLLLFRSWTGKFKVDKVQFLCRWGIVLKVPNDFLFSIKPLNSQQGLPKPSPENKWSFRTYLCAVMYNQQQKCRFFPKKLIPQNTFLLFCGDLSNQQNFILKDNLSNLLNKQFWFFFCWKY